jgi:CTP:molybdopterin cytidylyltransferase MocA
MSLEDSLTAIILAAGSSSRMGMPKATLILKGYTVLELIIRLFRDAGISDIRVVTGCDREDISPVIQELKVREIFNPRYQDGMYSSVRNGVASCHQETAGFFIHPVDIPLIRSDTIKTLSSCLTRGGRQIICPVYQGRRGHPMLISASFRTAIIRSDRPGGLRVLLYEYTDAIVPVQVNDSGILFNMNTPEEYQEALMRIR